MTDSGRAHISLSGCGRQRDQGNLVATPLQWAARNGLDLLIQQGANPRLFDIEGYSLLPLRYSVVQLLGFVVFILPA